jgi:hypothetical protein
MKLIPKKVNIPLIGETENVEDPIVYTKIFHPFSSWRWFVIEYSKKDELCFGLIEGHEVELGYFSLDELKELRIKGLPVERDLHWSPIKLSELKNNLRNHLV